MTAMMAYPGGQMGQLQMGHQQVYMVFPVPVMPAGAHQQGGGGDGAWVPVAMPGGADVQMPCYWGETQQPRQGDGAASGETAATQPAANGQLLHWYGQAHEAEPPALAPRGPSRHWADPSAQPFTPSARSKQMDASAKPFQPMSQGQGQEAAQALSAAGAEEVDGAAASVEDAPRTRTLANSTRRLPRVMETPVHRGLTCDSWTSTIRALNLEPKSRDVGNRQSQVKATEQEKTQVKAAEQEKKMEKKMHSPLPGGAAETVSQEAAPAFEPVAAVPQRPWGPKPKAESEAAAAASPGIEGTAPTAGQVWGRGPTRGSPAAAKLPSRAGAKVEAPVHPASKLDDKKMAIPQRKPEVKKTKEDEKKEEEAKPLAGPEWPSLMPTPKPRKGATGAASSAVASEAAAGTAATPKAAELPSRVAGTAWGKAGGAVKHLKDVEAAKAAKAAEAAKAAKAAKAAEAAKEAEEAEAARLAEACKAEQEASEAAKAAEAARAAEEAARAAEAAEASEAQRRSEEEEHQRVAEAADAAAAAARQEAARLRAMEEAAARRHEEEQRRLAEEAAAREREEERRRLAEEAAAREREEELRRLAEEAAAREREEERRRLAEEAAAREREEERRRLAEEAAAREQEEDQRRLAEEAAARELEEELRRLAEEAAAREREEELRRLAEEAAAREREEEQRRLAEEAATRELEQEEQRHRAEEAAAKEQEEDAREEQEDNEVEEEGSREEAEKAVEGWEDDDWQDGSAQKLAPAKPAKEERLPSSEKHVPVEENDEKARTSEEGEEEGGWDDDDWQTDAKATFKPALQPAAEAESKDASSSSTARSEAKQGDAQDVEEETCTPLSSSDEAEMTEGSPMSAAVVEDEASRFASAAVTGDRNSLMAFRSLGAPVPKSLASFRAAEHETAWKPSAAAVEAAAADAGEPSDRKLFGSRSQQRDRDGGRGSRQRDGDGRGTVPGSSSSSRAALLTASANAYKVQRDAQGSREAELKRSVNSSLNKICPENVDIIVGKIVETKVSSSEELQMVIGYVMKKAHAEPHYCETYADLVYKLKAEMPEFPAPDGGKPISFKSTLLNCCQNEFETMISQAPDMTPEEVAGLDPEEVAFRKSQRKARTLANIKFIGHLFLRQLLTAKIIGSVVSDLAMCDCADALPGEHVVECICELLNSIGYTLESMPAGKGAVSQVCGRLMDLKSRTDKRGKGVYSKRIQFGIQDLLDTRAAGWTKKVFKAAAKTKEEIRNEQNRDIKAQAAGKGVDGSEQVIAGARPAWLTAGPTAGRDDGPWQEVSKPGRR